MASVALAITASLAAAATKTIGGFIGGAAYTTAAGGTGGSFNQPRDVAVFEGTDGDAATDKIFVVEGNGNNSARVQRFDVDGNFELMWGKNVDPSNPSTGFEVCAAPTTCQGQAGAANGILGGEFDDPHGIAVNQSTGDVYVWDRDNRRVQQFTQGGAFVRTFGWNVIQAAPTGGSTDLGDVYEVCEVAIDCQAASAGTQAGRFGATTLANSNIAVAPPGSSVAGDVFVVDPANRRVQQFTAAGAFVAAWGFNVSTLGNATTFEACAGADCQAAAAAGNENGRFQNNPLRIAVDSSGMVYVSDASTAAAVGGANRVIRFDATLLPAGATIPNADTAANSGSGALTTPIACCGTAGSAPLVDGVTTGLEIDPDSDGGGPDEEHLLVVRDPAAPASANTVVQEFDIPSPSSAAITDEIADSPHVYAAAANNGIGVSSANGNIYLAISVPAPNGPGAGLIVLNEDGGDAPVVTIGQPTDIGATTATVTGQVDIGGIGTYRFEISTDGVNWTPAGSNAFISGSSPVQVSRALAGLSPNTTYRVRLVASKVTGMTTTATATSLEAIFITDAVPPEVETRQVTDRQSTTAALVASIDPNGSATQYYFEYGPTAGYGRRVPVPSGTLAPSDGTQIVQQPVSGLTPGVTYHYRIVAENAAGLAVGSDVSFTTRSALTPPGGRAYELVSPADKLGGQGVGDWYVGIGSHVQAGKAAKGADRFLSTTGNGAVLADSDFAYANDAVMGERTAAGWTHRKMITRGGYAEEPTTMLFMVAWTGDFTRSQWISNGPVLNFFPETENWPTSYKPIMLGDDAGRWEQFSPTDLSQTETTEALPVTSEFSDDGSSFVMSHKIKGLAGSGDPTGSAFGDSQADRYNVWLGEMPTVLTDTFPGATERSLVNVCTDGTLIPRRTPAGKLEAQPCPAPTGGRSATLIDPRGAVIGSDETNSVSDDGSRIFFTTPQPPGFGSDPSATCSGTDLATQCPSQLYVRQETSDGVVTRWISRSSVPDQDASLSTPVTFEGASADGDKVFFRTAAPLTADDPNGGAPVAGGVVTGNANAGSVDLFMYDMPNDQDADPATGTLTRISAGPNGNADSNTFVPARDRAALRFVNAGGDKLYFATAAPILGAVESSSGITSPGGTAGTSDQVNIYHYDAAKPQAERWRFVARLRTSSAFEDCASAGSNRVAYFQDDIPNPGLKPAPGTNCVRGTADGFVTFFTNSRLTADDPDATSMDLYGYDPVNAELTRISGPQGGTGGSYQCAGNVSEPCFATPDFASRVLGMVTAPQTPGDRVVFFMSGSRLVPGDTDDAHDVYEWRNGELSLLSVGTNEDTSYMGNDRAGRNVYMATRDQLTWQDHDRVLDIYTARVGGGIPQPAPPEPCSALGDACQGGGGAPTPTAPATDTPAGGDGNAGAHRPTISMRKLSGRQLRALARGKRVNLTIVANASGTVSVAGTARVRGKSRRVLRGLKRARGAGAVKVPVTLTRAGRLQLRRSRRLAVTFGVSLSGMPEPVTSKVVLRGAKDGKRTKSRSKGGTR